MTLDHGEIDTGSHEIAGTLGCSAGRREKRERLTGLPACDGELALERGHSLGREDADVAFPRKCPCPFDVPQGDELPSPFERDRRIVIPSEPQQSRRLGRTTPPEERVGDHAGEWQRRDGVDIEQRRRGVWLAQNGERPGSSSPDRMPASVEECEAVRRVTFARE